jgi:hypothetical protein
MQTSSLKNIMESEFVTFEELTDEQLAQRVPKKALRSRFAFKEWCLNHFTATHINCGGKCMVLLRVRFPDGGSFVEIRDFLKQR